ncbi:hypothetical protein DPX16_16108 [Anabarilius grahami]|uniref:Interleukin-12 receptor subunit beta-2 n=1 Tax=Anabarilius grahami TaxID=495550 RepID=A0A3N0YNE6_ANAGA|nr:hypothetical protein DPX16_16108 [Anabarilius grahami]
MGMRVAVLLLVVSVSLTEVKYSKPQITSMKRSAGILNLTLDKPKDNKSVIYEIRWRERGSKWQNATFETQDSTIQDFYKLHLQKQTIYQIQLRRQAKLQPHLCKDSLQTLWSDWSPLVDVPLEISLPPVIRWAEKKWTNGTREINLIWDEPPAKESAGGVEYKLNIIVWPCKKNRTKETSTSNRTYKTSITYSEARISIIAINNVGSSPPKEIIIPSVKYLGWVEKFVRHYYFLHTMSKKHHKTVEMCPFYSEQGGLSWQDQTILSICVVALLCTIICSVAVRRFRSKLIPEVPSPVIDTAELIVHDIPNEKMFVSQNLSQMTEEVHEFVLLLLQDLGKPSENDTPEQSTLLQGFGLVVFEEEDEEDEEGEVAELSSMKSCCYPNPSYRGQTLHLPEPFHMTDSTLKDNDTESTYRNGLFFETRIIESDNTSL